MADRGIRASYFAHDITMRFIAQALLRRTALHCSSVQQALRQRTCYGGRRPESDCRGAGAWRAGSRGPKQVWCLASGNARIMFRVGSTVWRAYSRSPVDASGVTARRRSSDIVAELLRPVARAVPNRQMHMTAGSTIPLYLWMLAGRSSNRASLQIC